MNKDIENGILKQEEQIADILEFQAQVSVAEEQTGIYNEKLNELTNKLQDLQKEKDSRIIDSELYKEAETKISNVEIEIEQCKKTLNSLDKNSVEAQNKRAAKFVEMKNNVKNELEAARKNDNEKMTKIKKEKADAEKRLEELNKEIAKYEDKNQAEIMYEEAKRAQEEKIVELNSEYYNLSTKDNDHVNVLEELEAFTISDMQNFIRENKKNLKTHMELEDEEREEYYEPQQTSKLETEPEEQNQATSNAEALDAAMAAAMIEENEFVEQPKEAASVNEQRINQAAHQPKLRTSAHQQAQSTQTQSTPAHQSKQAEQPIKESKEVKSLYFTKTKNKLKIVENEEEIRDIKVSVHTDGKLDELIDLIQNSFEKDKIPLDEKVIQYLKQNADVDIIGFLEYHKTSIKGFREQLNNYYNYMAKPKIYRNGDFNVTYDLKHIRGFKKEDREGAENLIEEAYKARKYADIEMGPIMRLKFRMRESKEAKEQKYLADYTKPIKRRELTEEDKKWIEALDALDLEKTTKEAAKNAFPKRSKAPSTPASHRQFTDSLNQDQNGRTIKHAEYQLEPRIQEPSIQEPSTPTSPANLLAAELDESLNDFENSLNNIVQKKGDERDR